MCLLAQSQQGICVCFCFKYDLSWNVGDFLSHADFNL